MRHMWWICLAACAARAPADVTPTAPRTDGDDAIRRSPLDERAYRHVVLDNGLQALLISDPDTEMAAAALSVDVGHYADPEDRQGLAHFLEHMLFMGTDRFPGVDDYRKFIEDHGGSSNAGTGGERTTYFFQIEQDALHPAFERFARFFVSPNLDPAYVERERNAVHSEYSLKIQDNWRRSRQVRKSTTNPAHPEHKFSVGNLDTLADREGRPVYADLRALYEAEYRPDRMAMAILGREPLDTLEGWVRTDLSEVPGAPAERPERPPPFTDDQLGVRIDIVPLEERRELELQFPVPAQQAMWPDRPYAYLSQILGHEGEGTLFDVLKGQGWIERLGSGTTAPGNDYDLISLTYTLTEAGVDHLDDIVAASFAAIGAIRDGDRPAYPYDEARTMAELGFQYAEAARPASAVRWAASMLHDYPAKHVLDHGAIWADFNRDRVDAALGALTVDNLRLLVTLPGLETDQVEPLYRVPWGMRPLTDAERAHFTGGSKLAIALPVPNAFLPASTALIAGAEALSSPTPLTPAPGVELWTLPDTSWGVPRGMVTVRIYSPAPRTDGVRSQVLGQLGRRVINDALQAFRYPLDEAGLDVHIGLDDRGMTLSVSGYDHGQQTLIEELAGRLRSVKVEPKRLDVVRAAMVREWGNTKRARPLSQVLWAEGEAFDTQDFDRASAIGIAEEATAAEVQAHLDGFFEGASVRAFVHGNHSAADATAIGRTLGEALVSGDPTPRPAIQRRLLEPGQEVVRDVTVDHNDSVLVVTWQGAEPDLASTARWMLLGSLLETAFFSELRTEQQLGYAVGIRYRRMDQLPGLRAVIQSPVAGPVTLLDRVDTFLGDYHAVVDTMPIEEFETVRAGLVSTLTEPPTQLSQHNARLARNLHAGVYTFDLEDQIAAEIAQLTHDEMFAFYEEVLLSESAGRLITRSFGTVPGTAHAEEAAAAAPGCPNTACIAAALPRLSERVLAPIANEGVTGAD